MKKHKIQFPSILPTKFISIVLKVILLTSILNYGHGKSPTASIELGIDRIQAMGFRGLLQKRVGLLTHPAGVNKNGISSIDILRNARNVDLVVLFGPEHGIYGNEKANIPVDNKIDPKTRLPVYSLYGKYRKPTPKMLSGIDVLVIDLQDIGVRSYTYVSCMRYAIEACFENNVEVMVLDRPNPLGGNIVDGPIIDKKWMSYVGAFQVPYVHGLTIAELARMAKSKPGWLNTSEKHRKAGKLTVVPMKGWNRNMLWSQTKLKWIPTSPYIPSLSAVAGYPMTGLGAQVGDFSHGIGSPFPFRLLNYKGKKPKELSYALKNLKIPGLSFAVYQSPSKKSVSGVYIIVKDWSKFRPTELSFHMMKLCCEWESTNPFSKIKKHEANLFNKHVGSTAWWNELLTKGKNLRLEAFLQKWRQDALQFKSSCQNYLLYN